MNIKIFLILLFIPIYAFSQKQVKIDWPSLANSPWPVLRGDMQGTGRSEYIGPRTFSVKWVKDEPRGVLLGPVIGYDENLYFGEMAVNLNDNYNLFYAVNKNGDDLWTYKTKEFYPNNGGCILGRDSTIYFHSANGNLYALNKDGILKWSTFVVQGSGDELFMDKTGNIYIPCFDTLRVISPEGVMKKYYYPNIKASLSFSIGGDTIFVETGRENLGYLGGTLDAADLKGNVYWSYKFGNIGWGIPMVDNQNNIYVFGADTNDISINYLNCIKPDGSVKWQFSMEHLNKNYCPTMDYKGNITFLSPYYENGIYHGAITSLDYNGNLRWTDTINDNQFSAYMDYGPVCDKEGKIYCGSNFGGGYFYCIDSNGVTLWKHIFPNEYDSCPAIAPDGTMYIGLQKGDYDLNQTQTLFAIKDSVTDIKDERGENVKNYQLQQNYPNPFNPSTTINYSLPKAGNIKLTIYNAIGSKVATIVNEYEYAGNYSVQFNPANLASGIYLYRLESGNFSMTRKLILIK